MTLFIATQGDGDCFREIALDSWLYKVLSDILSISFAYFSWFFLVLCSPSWEERVRTMAYTPYTRGVGFGGVPYGKFVSLCSS